VPAGTRPAPPAGPPAPPAPAQPDATAAWVHRAEPGELEKAIAAWERLAAAAPARADLDLALAQAYVLLAERRREAGAADAQTDAFANAVRASEAALAAASPTVAARLGSGVWVEDALEGAGNDVLPAVYWYATSLAGYALARGLTGTVHFQHRVEALFNWVLGHDETFACGGAHRGLGSWHARTPAAAGGDLSRSRQHFERALAIAPACAQNRITYAEDYAVAAQDRALFTRLLGEARAALAAAPASDADQVIARGRAERLLAHVDALF
jgi:tetratricopeptide (TPR) repeat protein